LQPANTVSYLTDEPEHRAPRPLRPLAKSASRCATRGFYESDDPGDGYIVQCSDGMYSLSGGERGACSYHSGVQRPLYSH